MKKILANDGIDAVGKDILEKAGFTVFTEKVAQEALIDAINRENYIALTVRSATKVRKDLIDACVGLKLIGRGGVGMDNIDVEYAKSKGLEVVNTPAASSASVAELVFAHLSGLTRWLHDSNRMVPVSGKTDFEKLKKKYSKGIELRNKTIGIVGFGRIGQAVAKIALGLGMKVEAFDPFIKEANITLEIHGFGSLDVKISTIPFEALLNKSDFITFHVPGSELVSGKEIALMKNGVILVNAARGGVINEEALLDGLNSGRIAFAGLDVYNNEPTPSEALLIHPKISLTPHIGAATEEAQERIGVELAEKIIQALRGL